MKTLLLGSIMALLFNSCIRVYENEEELEFKMMETATAEETNAFQDTLHPFLIQNCGGCHGVDQSPLFALDSVDKALDNLVDAGLVNFESLEKSFIVNKIKNGHQGYFEEDADQIQDLIQQWRDLSL